MFYAGTVCPCYNAPRYNADTVIQRGCLWFSECWPPGGKFMLHFSISGHFHRKSSFLDDHLEIL